MKAAAVARTVRVLRKNISEGTGEKAMDGTKRAEASGDEEAIRKSLK